MKKMRGSKGLLKPEQAQHTRKGSIDVMFVKDMDTDGTHVKMVTQMTKPPY
jgi:hypothetical protein